MSQELRIKLGFGLCVFGLAIALLSFVPTVVSPTSFPWPVFAGSMVYLPGSILVFFSSRGIDRNKNFNLVRFVRLGFFAIIAVLSVRVLNM